MKINDITNELQKQLDKVQDELREREHEIMITMLGEQETYGGVPDKTELFTTQVLVI